MTYEKEHSFLRCGTNAQLSVFPLLFLHQQSHKILALRTRTPGRLRKSCVHTFYREIVVGLNLIFAREKMDGVENVVSFCV